MHYWHKKHLLFILTKKCFSLYFLTLFFNRVINLLCGTYFNYHFKLLYFKPGVKILNPFILFKLLTSDCFNIEKVIFSIFRLVSVLCALKLKTNNPSNYNNRIMGKKYLPVAIRQRNYKLF